MASPLTLMLQIIPGTNLSALTETHSGNLGQFTAALQSIGTIHYARSVLLDTSQPNLLPTSTSTGPFVLAIITTYDGNFDQYIQDFVSDPTVAAAFDATMEFVVGGAALIPVANNLAAFQAFIQQNDASEQPPNNNGFGQAYTATVQQILAALPANA
jgi:hypothetical protein